MKQVSANGPQRAPVTDVAIVGAGPYGLSLAAHLAAAGVDFRIFGEPMRSWLHHMPRDMQLKSAGFASNLSDPAGSFTLRRFCAERGIPYADSTLPVSRRDFAAYGSAFQERLVPNVERKTVVSVERESGRFRLVFADGEVAAARAVVVATGVVDYAHVPDELAGLPPELLSHSSQHTELTAFRGRRVAVIGAGASAIEVSCLLHEAGSDVQLVTRQPVLRFLSHPAERRPLGQRMFKPMTGMGPGWRAFLYQNAPPAFRLLPLHTRKRIVSGFLPAEGGWFSKARLVGHVPLLLGRSLLGAQAEDGAAVLRLLEPDGTETRMRVAHVVAATGYRPDIGKVRFLSAPLRSTVKTVHGSPVLSPGFETSVPGLFFVGLPAVLSFGPMFRFVLGADFAARRLAAVFGRRRGRAGTAAQPLAYPAQSWKEAS